MRSIQAVAELASSGPFNTRPGLSG